MFGQKCIKNHRSLQKCYFTCSAHMTHKRDMMEKNLWNAYRSSIVIVIHIKMLSHRDNSNNNKNCLYRSALCVYNYVCVVVSIRVHFNKFQYVCFSSILEMILQLCENNWMNENEYGTMRKLKMFECYRESNRIFWFWFNILLIWNKRTFIFIFMHSKFDFDIEFST